MEEKVTKDRLIVSRMNSQYINTAQENLRVQHYLVGDLQPHLQNSRTHTKKQIQQIKDSIREFGFNNPVLTDDENRILAGHGRVEAAKLLGMKTVPTIRLSHMNEPQKRAYVIADNKLAENAGWNRDLLALELQYLAEIDVDFDLTITGLETTEIDILLEEIETTEDDLAADNLPDVDPEEPTVSRPGDLWRLGPHCLLCEDATLRASFRQLMGRMKAQMVFIDPPYNVRIDGHVCGLGKIHHEDFAMASGEMTQEEFTKFLQNVFGHLVEHSKDGSIHYVCMDWRHIFELLSAARNVYSEMKNLCVWNKNNAGMGSFYRSKHELISVFKSGTRPHINNFELGQNGRYRTNVWDYPGINSFGSERAQELEMHPTVKPVALVADAILDCSKRGGIVLDCFGGSGTTIISAEKTGRKAYVIELEPKYVDTACRRWEGFSGEVAIHEKLGLSFNELKKEREIEE